MNTHNFNHNVSLSSTFEHRVKPYRNIHKALRSLMLSHLVKIGQLDTEYAADKATWSTMINELMDVLHSHLSHENVFFHRAIQERAPQAIARFDRDHAHHEQAIAALRELVLKADQVPGNQARLAYDSYLKISVFIAENLLHMAEEETALTEALWQHFSDAEILEIEHQLVASLTPEENQYFLKLIFPALSHSERLELLTAMQAGMPAEVFAAVLKLTESVLDAENWQRLQRHFAFKASNARSEEVA